MPSNIPQSGWPPGDSLNYLRDSGMDPEVARQAAWARYNTTQGNNMATGGGYVQAKPGIDPMTGKPITPPSAGPSMYGPFLPKGPTVYDPVQNSTASGGGGSQSVLDYLNSKWGGMSPYVKSVTSLAGAGQPGGYAQIVKPGSSGGDISSYIKMIMDAQNKANAANEGRYNEAKGLLANYGKSYQNQLNENYKQDVGQQEQNAISRGLGNTTIRNSLLAGSQRRRDEANLSLADRLAAQRVNLLQSKYDNAPNIGLLAQLLQNATQNATGSGGSLASIAAALGLNG